MPDKNSQDYIKEPGILAEYFSHLCEEAKIKPSTAYNYYMTLRTLAKFLKHQRNGMDCQPDEVVMARVSDGEMLSITEDEWMGYLDYFQFTNSERNGSLAVRISATKGFYVWLAAKNNCAPPPHIIATKRPKQSKSIRTPVNERMEDVLCDRLDGELKERNNCIIRLFLRCGLGLHEIRALDLEDVEMKSILVGSGTAKRSVPLDEVSAAAVNQYIAVRHPPTDGSNALFVSAKKGRMSRAAIQKLLRKAVRMAGPSCSGVTARDLQSTAKERIVRTYGVVDAANIINIQTPRYFRSTYANKNDSEDALR